MEKGQVTLSIPGFSAGPLASKTGSMFMGESCHSYSCTHYLKAQSLQCSLYMRLPLGMAQKIQLVQNSAIRLLMGSSKFQCESHSKGIALAPDSFPCPIQDVVFNL